MDRQWSLDFIDPVGDGFWCSLLHFSVPTGGANANIKKALEGE